VLGGIYSLAREVFELPPRSVETIGYLAAPSRFLWQDWRWSVRPGISGSIIARLLPGARARMLRAIENKLVEEHNMACGRLRHDFAARAQVAFDDYVASVRRGLSAAVEGMDRAIERAISQKHRTTEEAAEVAGRVAAQSERLQSLIAALRAALPARNAHFASRAAD